MRERELTDRLPAIEEALGLGGEDDGAALRDPSGAPDCVERLHRRQSAAHERRDEATEHPAGVPGYPHGRADTEAASHGWIVTHALDSGQVQGCPVDLDPELAAQRRKPIRERDGDRRTESLGNPALLWASTRSSTATRSGGRRAASSADASAISPSAGTRKRTLSPKLERSVGGPSARPETVTRSPKRVSTTSPRRQQQKVRHS